MSFNEKMIDGNLAADPELRYTPDGTAVCNFTITDSQSAFDEETKQWKSVGEPHYTKCVAWRALAENIAASAVKGTAMHVHGREKTKTWNDAATQEKKYGQELVVSYASVSLAHATAVVTRNNAGAARGSNAVANAPAAANNTRPANNSAQAPSFAPPSDEPPF